ncbi:MAG: hypothetical protein R3E53_16940 [Myxococcota bacterium]
MRPAAVARPQSASPSRAATSPSRTSQVDGLESLRKELATTGRDVSTHVVDVSSASRMQAFAAEVEARHGTAHVLINNEAS